MSTKSELQALIKRVEAATGPDREIDAEIAGAILPLGQKYWAWQSSRPKGTPNKPQADYWRQYAPAYTGDTKATGDIKAIVGLIERELPGWAWKVGTCSVSDDAWLAPDFNSPVHGERLRAEFPTVEAGSIWDTGIDIDRRPAGSPALALTAAFLSAKLALMGDEDAE